MKKSKIAVVSSSRAEYGILFPLFKRIDSDNDLILSLIVTGGHLLKEQGYSCPK